MKWAVLVIAAASAIAGVGLVAGPGLDEHNPSSLCAEVGAALGMAGLGGILFWLLRWYGKKV